MNVLFVCVANGGRSVMAERLFRELAGGRHQARSAGSEPGRAPHPQVVEALRSSGSTRRDHVPRRLDAEALDWADIAVSTCSEEVCPVTPGVRRISWELPTRRSLPLDQVRPIRDEITRRVEELVAELDRPKPPLRRSGFPALSRTSTRSRYALGVVEAEVRPELARRVGLSDDSSLTVFGRGAHAPELAELWNEMTEVRRSEPGATW